MCGRLCTAHTGASQRCLPADSRQQVEAEDVSRIGPGELKIIDPFGLNEVGRTVRHIEPLTVFGHKLELRQTVGGNTLERYLSS